jgi:hypothetical protein
MQEQVKENMPEQSNITAKELMAFLMLEQMRKKYRQPMRRPKGIKKTKAQFDQIRKKEKKEKKMSKMAKKSQKINRRR